MQQVMAIGLFCEDVREEKSGADTLIGIFPDNLGLNQLPATLPRLGFYTRIIFDPNTDPGPISVRLKMPDDSLMNLTTFDPNLVLKTRNDAISSGAPTAGLITRGVASPFNVLKTGRILIIAKVGEREIVCGHLNIQLAS